MVLVIVQKEHTYMFLYFFEVGCHSSQEGGGRGQKNCSNWILRPFLKFLMVCWGFWRFLSVCCTSMTKNLRWVVNIRYRLSPIFLGRKMKNFGERAKIFFKEIDLHQSFQFFFSVHNFFGPRVLAVFPNFSSFCHLFSENFSICTPNPPHSQHA